MPNFAPTVLHDYVRATCAALGSSATEQRLVADQLVAANLAGHDSHGVGMVPAYVAGALAGELLINGHPEIVQDSGALVILDGKQAFGQVNGFETMNLAIERAREHGVALVGLRNSSHIGRIGHWGEQCAAAGLASIHFVNVNGHGPLVAPYGGRSARFITNPVCLAVPGPADESGRRPLAMLDMATSTIAAGKARVAFEEGRPIPDNAMIDSDGRVTTDPSGLFDQPRSSALLAFGDHKGSGLAIMAELLGAALIGGQTMQPGNERKESRIINNMLSIVIDPAATGSTDGFIAEASAYLDYVRDSELREGFTEVLMPGEPEQRSRVRRAEQVPVDANTVHLLRQAATTAGVAGAEDLLRDGDSTPTQ
jgi:hydroxycarboxylate dehydrogenase B